MYLMVYTILVVVIAVAAAFHVRNNCLISTEEISPDTYDQLIKSGLNNKFRSLAVCIVMIFICLIPEFDSLLPFYSEEVIVDKPSGVYVVPMEFSMIFRDTYGDGSMFLVIGLVGLAVAWLAVFLYVLFAIRPRKAVEHIKQKMERRKPTLQQG